MNDSISQVNIIQINLQHAKASSTLLAADLARLHTPLALIQEPYIHNGKILGFEQSTDTNLIYDTSHNRPRVCIAIDRKLVFHELPQFTNQDFVAVKVKFSRLAHNNFCVIVSLYLPFEKLIRSVSLYNVLLTTVKLIICHYLLDAMQMHITQFGAVLTQMPAG